MHAVAPFAVANVVVEKSHVLVQMDLLILEEIASQILAVVDGRKVRVDCLFHDRYSTLFENQQLRWSPVLCGS